MHDQFDVTLEDADLLGEVELTTNLIIAASEADEHLSTAEIESALVGHEGVAEAAVVGAADETTGQAVVAYVILTAEAAADSSSTTREFHVRSR